MGRAAGWLGIVALAVYAHLAHSDALRALIAFAAIGLIGASVPASLRRALALLALVALACLLGGGSGVLLDALPVLIAAFVAWLFARTLRHGRTPLIGRAIVALDGSGQLDDASTARYARQLTWLWAIWQTTLALIGAACAAGVGPAWLPGARTFGIVVLPGAVVLLFLAEFALRPRLLPQAPRHRLWPFVRALVQAWPQLLQD